LLVGQGVVLSARSPITPLCTTSSTYAPSQGAINVVEVPLSQNTAEVSLQQKPHTPPIARRAWLTVTLLALLMFVNFAAKIGVGLAGTPVERELGIGAAQFGVVQSSFFWLFAAGSILGGWLGSRIGSRWLLGIVAALWAVSLAPLAGQVSFTGLILCRVLLGFAEGPTAAVALQATHSWFPAHRRALPTTFLLLGAGLGPVIAAPALTALIKARSWHAAFASLAVVGAVLAIAWLFIGRDGPIEASLTSNPATADSGPAPHEPVRLRRLFATPTVIGAMLLMFAVYGDAAAKLSWLPLYLEKGLGYDPTTSATYVAIPLLVAALATIAVGLISRAMTRRGLSNRASRGLLPSALTLVGGLVTLAYPFVGRGWAFVVLVTISSCLITGGYPVVFAGLSDLIPARQRMTAFGIIAAVYSLGAVIAPALVGVLVADAPKPLAGFSLGFLIIGIAVMAGGIAGATMINPERDAARLRSTTH
jgi:MFS family permease